MRRSSLALFTALALALSVPTAPAATRTVAATPKPAGFTLPLNVTADGVTFTGALRLQRFAIGGTALVASGLLTGTLVDQAGKVTAVVRNVSLPVTQGTPDPSTPPPTTPPPPTPPPARRRRARLPPNEPPEPDPLDADLGSAPRRESPRAPRRRSPARASISSSVRSSSICSARPCAWTAWSSISRPSPVRASRCATVCARSRAAVAWARCRSNRPPGS